MINQEDLLEIYNNLTVFSKTTVEPDKNTPTPISVKYDRENANPCLVFEQRGITVRLRLPIFYSLGLETIREGGTYLLPEDYNGLMGNLRKVIESPKCLDDKTLLSPENYGFDVYAVDYNELWKGLEPIGKVRFISGNSWIFKWWTKWKYKLI